VFLKMNKYDLKQLAKKLFNPYGEELKFKEKDWEVFLNRLLKFEQVIKEEEKEKLLEKIKQEIQNGKIWKRKKLLDLIDKLKNS